MGRCRRTVGLLRDHVLHGLVGEEGCDREEGRHHGHYRRRDAGVAPNLSSGCLVALLEVLV